MITHISWDHSVANEAKIVRRFPESRFECPKMNPGDLMTVDMGRPKGTRILIPVRVVQVKVSTGWDVVNSVKQARLRDAEQYLYVEPAVSESSEQVADDESAGTD